MTQDGAAGAAPGVAFGLADRVGTGWRATLKDTTFKKGPAETMGVRDPRRPVPGHVVGPVTDIK